jgi:regulator of protease activity HflC (stomatin/prohibitin superfamily)
LTDISKDIEVQCKQKFSDTPFEVISAFIGNCAPPAVVTEEIARKVAATQELQRKQTELEIAQKQEAIKTAEGKAAAALETETAKGKAAAMAQIKKELTTEFLTYEAIKGFNGANRVYVPLGGNGLPIVGNLDISDSPNGVLPPLPK